MNDSSTFGVVVLGMHRSGTSAAARLVNLMGFSLGPDEDLLPPRSDNPTGFWENASCVILNEEILVALGGEWSAPPLLGHGWESLPELDAFRPRAAALASTVLGAPQWAWKGPRACITLPFWLPIFGRDLAVVLVHRNPLEVATSLQAREGFPMSLGLALWERYIRSSLAAVAGLPVCVTSHEELVSSPAAWCRRVGSFLRARGAEAAELSDGEARTAVRPGLRHSAFSAESLSADPTVSPEQRTIAAVLEALPVAEDAFASPALPPETPWVEPLLDERRRRLHSARRLADATATLATIEASRSYRLLGPLRSIQARLATRHR